MEKIVYVTKYSEKDKEGKSRFCLEWPDNNIGYSCNETGLRGQFFYAILEEHIKSFKNRGYKVIYKN